MSTFSIRFLSLTVGGGLALLIARAGVASADMLPAGTFLRSVGMAAIIPASAAIPAMLVWQLHPSLTRAHVLAYFATLMAVLTMVLTLRYMKMYPWDF